MTYADRVRSKLRPSEATLARLFPSIEEELGPYRGILEGRVLNAGAGNRDLSGIIDGELVNQDLKQGLHLGHIDLWGPLDEIPVPDGHFDAIICNAVLEHVLNPESVMEEFLRVTHPGSVLYLGVPFMQPEHKDPADYQRYTEDGLRALCDRHGFEVREVVNVHAVETTFGWLLQQWLAEERRLPVLLVGRALYGWFARTARHSTHRVHAVASAYGVVALRR
jgi:SAM-dependent methyltransferase